MQQDDLGAAGTSMQQDDHEDDLMDQDQGCPSNECLHVPQHCPAPCINDGSARPMDVDVPPRINRGRQEELDQLNDAIRETAAAAAASK